MATFQRHAEEINDRCNQLLAPTRLETHGFLIFSYVEMMAICHHHASTRQPKGRLICNNLTLIFHGPRYEMSIALARYDVPERMTLPALL